MDLKGSRSVLVQVWSRLGSGSSSNLIVNSEQLTFEVLVKIKASVLELPRFLCTYFASCEEESFSER